MPVKYKGILIIIFVVMTDHHKIAFSYNVTVLTFGNMF